MLTIGNNKNTLDYNFDSFSDIGVDIKNLSLKNETDKTDNRINEYATLLKVLSPDDFNTFYQILTDAQKTSLNQKNSYQRLSNSLQNLNISGQEFQSKICSILALKHQNSADLIRNPEFKSSLNIENIANILLFQSVLMHNPQGVQEIKGLSGLTSEQDDKRQQVLKKIAIASLVNENLHEKSLDILKDIPPQNFTEEDKKIIQLSIDFLSASIILASTDNKDEEAISQFNLLDKALVFYRDKFSSKEDNIELEIPKNFKMALEEKSKYVNGISPKDGKEELSPKVFGEISPVAPVLEKDSLQLVLKQLILDTLKERPSAMPAQGQANGPAGGSADRSV